MKKVLLIIGVVVLIFVGVVGYNIVKDLEEEKLLKQEIVNLTNKDLAKDDFSIEVKTKGDYAYIEESIKKYYKELSDNVKKTNELMLDDELINVLSPSNLASEDKSFSRSYKKVTNAKEEMHKVLDSLIELCTEEKILSLIDKDKVDSYYYDLYKDLMYTEEDLKDMEQTKKSAELLSESLDDFFDKMLEMLDFLKETHGKWYIEDNMLYFLNDNHVTEYNNLYKDLQKLAEDISKLEGTI